MTALLLALLMLVPIATPTAVPMPIRSAAPGRFVPSTPSPRDEVRASIGPDATVEGYTVTFSSMIPGFVVDPARLHVDRAALDGTLLARDVGTVVAAPDVQLGPPGPAQIVRVHVNVPRSALQPGMQNVVLRTDDGAARRNGAAVLLGTYAVTSSVHVDVPDPSGDDALRRRFAGKTVYGYGPLTLRCGVDAIPYAGLNTQPHTALRIARIERIVGGVPLHAGYDSSDAAFAFKAIDPLRIVFDPAVRPTIGGASFSYPVPSQSPPAVAVPVVPGPQRTAPMTPSPLRTYNHDMARSIMDQIKTTGCRPLDVFAADAWQLERLVTTIAPTPGLNSIRLGLTHEQVAQIDGFPSVYAKKADLMRMAEWRYDRPAPFSSVVTFDGDRVVKYQPPGNLP